MIPPGSTTTSGCEAADFEGFEPGHIALLQRGTCQFNEKAGNAEAAGASAVLIFNEGQPDRREVVRGTLGSPGINIPVVGVSSDLGETLVELSQNEEVILRVQTEIISETRQTLNVIADTPGGRDDFVVLVGAHLDSVPTGPGIQDNASGSATILEIARQLTELEIEPTNKVRFAFWGAEEFGLIGSRYYVDQLSSQELDQIALNLNFDMIASPNYSRFVYDGDRSQFRGGRGDPPPPGSGAIEAVFQDYFADQNLPLAETAFDGRSDYGPFIREGIPAGGLFTGAEEAKPPAEVDNSGGEGGVKYDAR
jgi:Zn-dependent M28 family amino/carboxypeptidase